MARKMIHEDDDYKILSFKKCCYISQNPYFLQFKSSRKFVKRNTEKFSGKTTKRLETKAISVCVIRSVQAKWYQYVYHIFDQLFFSAKDSCYEGRRQKSWILSIEEFSYYFDKYSLCRLKFLKHVFPWVLCRIIWEWTQTQVTKDC